MNRHLHKVLTELARGLVGQDYSAIRASYIDAIVAAMSNYLHSDSSITAFRNSYYRAVIEHFDAAFITGYGDAGGVISEMPEEDRAWFISRQNGELGNVDSLFEGLKILRKEDEGGGSFDAVLRHAEGYARTLDAIYSEGYMRGGRDEDFTFAGPDGQESCPECQAMKGKTKKAKWVIDNDMIPYPGTPHYSCKGFACQHYWESEKSGNILVA